MQVIIGYVTFLGIVRLMLFNVIKRKKVFVVIAGTLLFLIASFRSIYFGADIIGYISKYEYLSNEDLYLYWSNFISGEGKDPFFYLLAKVISIFGANYQVWLSILSGIFIYTVSKLIYKYSEEPYISFVALISLGYFLFSLTGLRQTLALSILLLSYKFLKERMLLKFICMVILAALFHSSALIFLIAYPLANMKIGINHILSILISLVLAVFFPGKIKEVLMIVSWSDQMQNYVDSDTVLTMSGFIIQLCIYAFCLFYRKSILKSDMKDVVLYNLLLLGLIFQSLSIVIAEFFRISMFFSVFSIILIPKALKMIDDKNIKVIIYLLVLSALIFYILWSGMFIGFEFFWEAG